MPLNWAPPDQLHRTAQALIKSGRAADPAEAEAILQGMVLQVLVGPGLEHSPAGQAALLTIVNAGHRAFLGGVRVVISDDPLLGCGWSTGLRLSEAVARYGGVLDEAHRDEHPTIVVQTPQRAAVGRRVLHATWSGWSGGVVQDPRDRLAGDGMVLAGVVAGGISVSETFQHCLGAPQAGRRDVGLSLWRPDLDWRDATARGVALSWLPRSAWLLGLGHLGQAYAWALGWLPYPAVPQPATYLVDFDSIVGGNLATGLLAFAEDVGGRKTRVVASRLEARGFTTTIVERAFDATLRPLGDEPGLALAGFDSPEPRRLLTGDRFERSVDAGLGGGHVEYLDIVLHTFPSQLDPEGEFTADAGTLGPVAAAYEAQVTQLIAEGADEATARCGIAEFAGISVGAAFVGAIAGALVVADPLRVLHEGASVAVLAMDLRNPRYVEVAANRLPDAYIPPAIEVAGP